MADDDDLDGEAGKQQAIIATLQLLLLDGDNELKASLIQAAFPGLIVGADYDELRDKLWLATDTLDECLSIADGSSGLGALAAKNLNNQLSAAKRRIETLGDFLNINRKPQPKPKKGKKQNWII